MSCAGCELISGPAQILVSGRKVCTSCPAWARECLARHMLSGWSLTERRDHLAGLDKRNPAEGEELRAVLTAVSAQIRGRR
jgi:hypothetical protein